MTGERLNNGYLVNAWSRVTEWCVTVFDRDGNEAGTNYGFKSYKDANAAGVKLALEHDLATRRTARKELSS